MIKNFQKEIILEPTFTYLLTFTCSVSKYEKDPYIDPLVLICVTGQNLFFKTYKVIEDSGFYDVHLVCKNRLKDDIVCLISATCLHNPKYYDILINLKEINKIAI